MAGKLEQEEVAKVLGHIKVSETIVQNYLHKNWKNTLDNYRGDGYFTGAKAGEVEVPLNIVMAMTDVIVPAVYFRDPAIRIRATIPGTDRLVRFHEARQNYLLKRTKIKRQARDVVLDAYLFGIGYFKIGYEAQVEKAYDPVINPDTGQLEMDEKGNIFVTDKHGNLFTEEPGGRVSLVKERDDYAAPPGRAYPMTNEYIEYEYPYALRWSPWDVLKDPFSMRADASDARWITFRTTMTVDEVKNHPFWENTGKVKANSEPDYIKDLRQHNLIQEHNENDRVVVYERFCKKYDKTTNSTRMYQQILVEGVDAFLFNEPSTLAVRGFPLVGLSFHTNPESPFPISPVEMLRPQINAINIARTQAANHRERFHQRYIANKSAGITSRDAKNFAKGGIGSVLLVKQPVDMEARKAFQPVDVPQMDQAVNQAVEDLWRDILRGSGITEHHFGGAGVARQATQASYIESALGVRLNMKQDLIADAILEVCQKWTDLDRQYGNYEQTFKVTGIDGETWETFKVADAIPEDFDLAADMHVAAFQAIEAEKAEMLQLANLVANVPGMNLKPVWERLFKAFGFPTPETMYTPPPPQMPGMEGEPTGSAAETAIDTNTANQALNPKSMGMNLNV